jgi:ADP-heptose:LPS heptosyltransferase
VGLHWTDAADPLNDPARSISLGDLVPLALPGITFIPMQKAEKPAQAHAPPPGLTLVPLAQRCRHVEDTAAVLSILDLLISIDSTPVHLAGALGRSVWILLPFASDWRWMLSRTDSPWYPTARLFRQSRPGDWGAVIQDVSAELGKLRQR